MDTDQSSATKEHASTGSQQPAAPVAPPPAPAASLPARPKEPDWDDYWAHRVAEKAKGKILGYFGLATLVLAVLGVKGLDEVKKQISEKFEEQAAKKEKEASDRVGKMLTDFQRQIDAHLVDVTRRKEEFMRVSVVSPAFREVAAASTPPALDLSGMIGAIGDQGAEGTTVGFSVAYALQAEIRRSLGKPVQVSARSIYTTAKRFDEWPGEDYEGTSVLGALKGLVKVGAHVEEQWPYAAKGKTAPNGAQPQYRIDSYSTLPNESQALVEALRKGKVPIIFIRVTRDFDTPDKDGRIVVKSAEETGGHSVAIVGYDPARSEFRFANMWGTQWGAKGFGLIRDTDLKKLYGGGYIIEKLAA